jgi:hypothetical protein
MKTFVFLAAWCGGVYQAEPCLIDPAAYGYARNEEGCRLVKKVSGWTGGKCVEVRIGK